MAIKFLSDIDDSQNKTIQFVIEDLLTAPDNPVKGQFYFNRTENTIYWYNGAKWINLNGLSFQQVDALPTTGEEGIIYLVPVSGEDYNYEKYFYYDNSWEPLGSASKIEIINNLTSTKIDAALSANQGKVLNDLKISSTDDTVDNIITLTQQEYNTLKTNNQLQEKTLYNIIDDTTNGGGSISVIDNLTSTSTTQALSANQGKVLKELVDSKANSTDIPNVTNFITTTDYATSSKGGVIKVQNNQGLDIDTGVLKGVVISASNYNLGVNSLILSKGTLENVIAEKLYTQEQVNTLLENYSTFKTYSYDTYNNDYRNAQDISDFISYEEFNKLYNYEYKTISFYTNYRSNGKLTINRYNVVESMSREHLTYSNINIVKLTLSNGNYVNLSADTSTQIVYKGEDGPNQASGGLACLIGDTLVNTEDGTKCIKDIQIGDKVLSYNKLKNKTEYKEVNNVYSHYTNLLFKIYTDEDVITCTYDEPFTTIEGYIVQACSLVKGAKLFTTENKEIVIKEIDKFEQLEPRVLVYDISVKDNYNYFVTKNKILVNTEDTTKKED